MDVLALVEKLKEWAKKDDSISAEEVDVMIKDMVACQTRYEQLLDITVVGYYEWDVETNKIFLSDGLRGLNEQSSGYLDRNTLEETFVVHPDDIKLRNEILARAIELGIDFQMEYRIRNTDGNYRYYLSKGKVVKDDEGKLIKVLGTLQDIEESKKKEARIQIQSFLIENTSTAILWVNENAQVVEANVAYAQLLGYSQSELVGMQMQQLDPYYNKDLWERARDRVKVEKAYMFTAVNVTKSGRVIEIDATLNYANVNGLDVYFVFITDITERNIRERELQLYEYVIQKSLMPIVWIDKSGHIVKANEAYCNMLGYKSEEILGNHLSMINPARNADVIADMWKELSIKSTTTYQTQNICKDGKVLDVEVTINSVVLNGLELSCAFIFDITDKKKQEKAIVDGKRVLDSLVENLPYAIQFWDKEGNLFKYNRAFKEMFHLSPERTEVLPLHAFNHPLMKDFDSHLFYKEVYQTKKSISFTGYLDLSHIPKYYPVEDKSIYNQKKYLRNTTFPILDSDGNIDFVASVNEDITKEKLIEFEKRKVLSQFQGLLDKVDGVLWELDVRTGKYTLVSNKLEDILGFKPQEWYDNPQLWLDHIHPEDKDKVVNEVALKTKTLSDFQVEYRMIKRSGEVVWLQSRVNVERHNGETVKKIGLLLDITRKKEADREFLNLKNVISSVIESTHDSIFALDTDYKYLVFNTVHYEAMYQIYGVKLKIGDDFSEILSKDESSITFFNKIRSAYSGERITFETSYVNRSNTRAYFETVCNPFQSQSTGKYNVAVFLKNITQMKLSIEALKESETRFRKLFNDIPNVAVQGYRRDGTIFFWNKASEQFYGYSYYDALGQNVNKLLFRSEEEIELAQKATESLFDMKAEGVKTSQSVLRRKDGSLMEVLSSNAFVEIPGNNGELFCFDIDITEREKVRRKNEKLLDELIEKNELIEINLQQKTALLEELRTTNTKLQTAIVEKDKYFSIIAHDLRSPLSAFMALTNEVYQNITDLTMEEVSQMLSSMAKSATNVYDLLENLLKWSQFQRGNVEFIPEMVYFDYIIQNNISIIKPRAGLKNICINYINKENTTLYADIKMLNLIIRNLLSNALKFSYKGSEIEIGVVDGKEENLPECLKKELLYNTSNFVFYVKDYGIGIPKNIMNNLFNIGGNVSRVGTDNESSTGLGLILSKEFVEMHKGRIIIDSEEGKGSTFYVVLPQFV